MMNQILKAAICSIFIIPMFTSCYDDKLLWDKVNEIDNRLDSLENTLNDQLSALNSLINGKTTISNCDKNADGSYDIELSNGVRFTVLAEGSKYSALVSVKVVDGVKYWATYDANGNLVVLTDPSGNPIPVVKEDYRTSVEVVVEEGIYYLVIDGKKYMTGYDTSELVQVFSSCTPHKDAAGNVYAMTFTFGEGVTVTVAVDGYNGVIFRLPNAAGASQVVSEFYISYGEEQPILLTTTGVLDYVMQVPDGWRIKERTDETAGETYLDITAPSKATVEAGAAVAEGDLKVVAVVEGGKAAITKLSLSADPFKVFNITSIKAEVEPYNGVQKYVYGVCIADDYDESTLINEVTEALKTTGDLPAGINISETAINTSLNEIYGAEMDIENAYIFWAIPALYSETDGYFVREGMFQTHRIAPIKVDISEPVASLFDAEITISIDGTELMYAGTALKSDDLFENIVYQINNGIIEPVAAEVYEGPASGFPTEDSNKGVEFMPATSYVTWVVPVEEEKTEYTANDIIFQEFQTKSVTSGGSLEVTLGEAVTDRTNISIPVSSEGAELIYYAYLSNTDGDRYSSLENDDKAELILEHETCVAVRGSEADASIERVKPNTTMWLYVMAVDKDGKYGVVNTMSAKTAVMEYNSLSLTVDALELASTKASFKIGVSGGTATDFIYWVGKLTDPFWANTAYLGGNRNSAQQYMACYPDDEHIKKAMSKHGDVAEDGTLNLEDLNMSTQYVLMVLAKDESGLYSKGGYKLFTTLAADLGTIVREGSEQWNTVKAQVEIDWIEESFHKGINTNMPSAFSFDFKCPKDFTAFLVCSSESYYNDEELFITVEDKMIDIEKYASRKYDLPIVTYDENGEMLLQPDWTNDNGEVMGGFLMNICDFYIHGVPSRGFVTYFAEGTHGQDNCTAWEGDACANYKRAVEKIQGYCTLEYWMNWFKEQKNMTNETYIRQNAQAYLDAHKPHYEGDTPFFFDNDGSALRITNGNAIGVNDAGEVLDDIVIVFKDKDGNYYEPMFFDVPNLFK